ncbi:hypothetical protein [Flavobacterium sp.]
MNDAHLHLIVNHFPIIGLIFGTGVLVVGGFSKSTTLKNTGYVLLIITAIFGFFSMYTGDGAEEMVEDIPNVGKKIIHEHEELAEKFVIVLYIIGSLSLSGLYLNFKKYSKANIIFYVTMGFAIIGLFFAQQVGTSGGEVRHTEIRKDSLTVLKDSTAPEDSHNN